MGRFLFALIYYQSYIRYGYNQLINNLHKKSLDVFVTTNYPLPDLPLPLKKTHPTRHRDLFPVACAPRIFPSEISRIRST